MHYQPLLMETIFSAVLEFPPATQPIQNHVKTEPNLLVTSTTKNLVTTIRQGHRNISRGNQIF